jgi:hypothetical protein
VDAERSFAGKEFSRPLICTAHTRPPRNRIAIAKTANHIRNGLSGGFFSSLPGSHPRLWLPTFVEMLN